MDTPNLLLETSIGAYLGNSSLVRYISISKYRVSYPFVKLQLFKDHLIIKFPKIFQKNEFKLLYSEIRQIELNLLYIRIIHTSTNNPQFIYLMGKIGSITLYKRLIESVKTNNLRLSMLPPDSKVKNSERIAFFLLSILLFFVMIMLLYWMNYIGSFFIYLFVVMSIIIMMINFLLFKHEILV